VLGEGELLGVALWSGENGVFDEHQRDKFKPYITQWGMDPIWQTAGLGFAVSDFPWTAVGIAMPSTSRIVGTGVPLALGVVISNGSGIQPDPVTVMLQITARPSGPLARVSTSGCAATIASNPRITVPLLFITNG